MILVLALIGGIGLAWPLLMAEAYFNPIGNWYPRQDPGVVLVVESADHREEIAFGRGGYFAQLQADAGVYREIELRLGDDKASLQLGPPANSASHASARYETVGPVGYGARWGTLNTSGNGIIGKRTLITTSPVGTHVHRDVQTPPGDIPSIAEYCELKAAYSANSALIATPALQRRLFGPIRLTATRPVTGHLAILTDLGFSIRWDATNTELRILLGAAGNRRPRIAGGILRHSMQEDGSSSFDVETEFTAGDGGLIASIPAEDLVAWQDQNLNVQIHVRLDDKGAFVTVTLKLP